MIQKKLLALILSLFCAISEAQGLDDIDQWGVITIGQEDPYYIMPSAFSNQDTRFSKNNISYNQFFYKDGKNPSNWQEQISFKAVRGKPDPAGNNTEVLKEILAKAIEKNCPSNFYRSSEEQLGDKKIGLFMGCRKLAIDGNTGIIGYHVIIEGRDSMFALAREARVANYDATPPISESELQKWKAHLQLTVICAKNDVCINKTKP